MKSRYILISAVLTIMALISPGIPESTSAQGFPSPMPAPPPMPVWRGSAPYDAMVTPGLYAGRFYVSAGIKIRNWSPTRFSINSQNLTIMGSSGTIPFGPTQAGPFGVGTGREGFIGGGFLDPFLAWTYDNGVINTTPDPTGLLFTCEDDPGPPPIILVCSGPDLPFSYSPVSPEMGRYRIISSGGCCEGTEATQQFGSFSIVDPTLQVDNLGSIAGTKTVSFSLAILDSLGFTFNTLGGLSQSSYTTTVGPTLEFGYQLYDYFDATYAFTWLGVESSMGVTSIRQANPAQVQIKDTFPFISDDVSAWPLFNFNSSNFVVGGTTGALNYRLATNSSGNGLFPTRQFLTQNNLLLIENIQQISSTAANINAYENRFGGRAWTQLWGMGKFGTTAGFAFIPTYYSLTGRQTFITQGGSNLVPPGTVISDLTAVYNDWYPHYGIYAGADTEIYAGRWFAQISADYLWATNRTYTLYTMETEFNPSGFSLGINGGLQF